MDAGDIAGAGDATGPLAGVRVVEWTSARAGRVAGMLLADLGADVVRVVPPGWRPAAPKEPTGPDDLCLDRGKRFAETDAPAAIRGLAARADVVLDDAPAGFERPDGLDAAGLRAASPSLVHVAMPPVGSVGRWRNLPADPLLVEALGGFAVFHPSTEPGTPVASVVPVVSGVHGVLGAVLAAAGLFAARRTGHGWALETTGLHASAACLAALVTDGLDVERIIRAEGRPNDGATFRTYRCADGRWLHLSTLTVDFFLPALEVLDRMDVMVMPGVDGEFMNLMRPEVGNRVGAELEHTFARRPRDEWLARMEKAGVPCAPVLPREEWLRGLIVADAAPPVTLPHPEAGLVLLPGVPIAFSDTPGAVGPLPTTGRVVDPDEVWTGDRATTEPPPDAPPPPLPLDGLRVVDLSTFLAAPFAGTLLAGLGAGVVKVETSRGDPYQVFSASYAAVNHAKTIATVDLRSPDGLAALLRLARRADVLIDNLRPASAARLGLSDDVLYGVSARLVRASVSAFGRTGPFADLPGFDPVLQSRSGLAAAQGGDGEPITTRAPTLDITTGALTALGVLAALVHRERTGQGQHLTTSLAATSTFLQLPELAHYADRPPTRRGGPDHRGHEPTRRYHRAADGWLALAASTPQQRRAVAAVLGLDALTDEGVAEVLATQPVEHWLTAFTAHDIPACPVPSKDEFLTDPYLRENDFTQIVHDPHFGRFRLVRGYFRRVPPLPTPPAPGSWPEAPQILGPATSVRPGYTTTEEPAGEGS